LDASSTVREPAMEDVDVISPLTGTPREASGKVCG
jgi:hypothetical protein